MVDTEVINVLVKIFFIILCTSFIVFKNIKHEFFNVFIILKMIITIILISILFVILNRNTNIIFAIIISVLSYCIITSLIINKSIRENFLVTIISLSVSFIFFVISGIVDFFIMKLPIINCIYGSLIEYIFIGVIQSIFIILFFKIKRFKSGIIFLKKENERTEINLIEIFISVLIIILFILLGNIKNNIFLGTYLIIGLALGIFIMFKWIKEKITENYKKKMIDRTIQIQAEEIKQKDEKIKELKAEIVRVSKINHSYNHRISSVEEALKKLEETTTKKENKEEIEKALNYVQKISKEYREAMTKNAKGSNKLNLTNIYGIDKILEYYKNMAEENNIDFNFKLNDSVNYIINNFLTETNLEILIGDLIKNSIIAINSSNNVHKSILIMLGLIDECYEFSIYDSGIEFEIETLLKLGNERITTHKKEGGTGIGFINIFETLKQARASLIIEEIQKPNKTDYTKAIIIKFDNKNEYIINSYRSEEINLKLKKSNQKGRIKIGKI